MSIPQRWPTVIVFYLVVSLFLAFFRLGASEVVTMEGITADGARYMARTQEYSVPRLHGEIYAYKPPLAYWLALASFRSFGVESTRTLRFPFALCGVLLGLGVLGLVGGSLGPRTGLLCALATLTGALFLQKFHLAEFDLPLTLGVGVATVAACRNLAVQRPVAWVWVVGYLGLALGFLAKGAPALMLYFPGALAAAFVTRRPRRLLSPAHLLAATVFVAIVGAWGLSAWQAEGSAAFEQPLSEALDKGASWTWALAWKSLLKPLQVWILFLPWSFVLVLALRRRGVWARLPEATRQWALAAGVFAASGVAVLMTTSSSSSRYFLPLAAAVGMLCGILIERSRERGGGALWAFLTVALLAWITHVFAVSPHRAESRSLRAIAVALEPHIPPDAPLWTGPVSKHFHHSSLFFYLRRPVRTFTGRRMAPAGSLVVLFNDEPPGLDGGAPFSYTVLESRSQRGYEFVLARVDP